MAKNSIINHLQDEIKSLRQLIENQSKAIDKAINDSKILRQFLEFPDEVAEMACINRKYLMDNDPDTAWKEGYIKALRDVKISLGIEYMPKEEEDKLIDDILKVLE